ncbi:hypothetical protein QWJ34_16930 [Saccharibacillus sp. CPCC 101409]|uniref:hypothetical protein n=1 Tax=Saccharibacillus sp. CPCC 101409 TaxID=3058041 RepID=UPI0026711399|nr:hypothetical protein [Saccharibacillus sp. CPCC 101409]MDO3411453.1 hypothetical protein [Saccharibacillus sp. CPCC 101409]
MNSIQAVYVLQLEARPGLLAARVEEEGADGVRRERLLEIPLLQAPSRLRLEWERLSAGSALDLYRLQESSGEQIAGEKEVLAAEEELAADEAEDREAERRLAAIEVSDGAAQPGEAAAADVREQAGEASAVKSGEASRGERSGESAPGVRSASGASGAGEGGEAAAGGTRPLSAAVLEAGGGADAASAWTVLPFDAGESDWLLAAAEPGGGDSAAAAALRAAAAVARTRLAFGLTLAGVDPGELAGAGLAAWSAGWAPEQGDAAAKAAPKAASEGGGREIAEWIASAAEKGVLHEHGRLPEAPEAEPSGFASGSEPGELALLENAGAAESALRELRRAMRTRLGGRQTT